MKKDLRMHYADSEAFGADHRPRYFGPQPKPISRAKKAAQALKRAAWCLFLGAILLALLYVDACIMLTWWR